MSVQGRIRVAAALLAAALLGGCDMPVQEPWLGEAQRNLYQQDQYQRSPETAEAMNDRLKYRVSDR